MGDGPEGLWPAGFGFLRLSSTDSTNEEARRRVSAGVSAPLWICAERQIAGRGRQGRSWAEAPGNLYSSLLLPFHGSASDAALLSFAACLSVADFFESRSGKAALKWPNDPLINGGKAAGVLLESISRGPVVDYLIIGIGVNLTAHPPGEAEAAHPPTDLMSETGEKVEPEDALAFIAARFAHWYEIFRNAGFAPLREAWLARAARIGEPVRARTQRETIEGVFETIDEAGALVLRLPSGIRKIHAADIYFR